MVILGDGVTGQDPVTGLERMGPHRARFLLESCEDLRRALNELGSDLLLLTGSAAQCIPLICQAIEADEVMVGLEPCAEEQAELAAVQSALGALPKSPEVITSQQRTLLKPEDLPFDIRDVPPVFSRFRRAVEKQFGKKLHWPKPSHGPNTTASAGTS